MFRHPCILVLLLISLGACATHPDLALQRLESLPQHYSQFDVDLAWEVRSAGSQAEVDGELRNLRYQFMDDIEVWVALLDAEGKQVARSVSYLSPHELRQNEIAAFQLTLPAAAPVGSKLRFTYNYTATDGGDSKGEYRTQSFTAVVPNR